MNISSQNLTGFCDYKCSYAINYSNSTSSLTNMGQYMRITYENTTQNQMMYNSGTYSIESISVYSPSLHLYNGVATDGEICIIHTPNDVGKNVLQVCIPLSTTTLSGQATDGANIISNWVSACSSGAAAQNESTNQGINIFTLNSLVPISQFYSYTGVNNDNSQTQDFVAYGIEEAIYISVETLATLTQMITVPATIIFAGGSDLFLNKTGTSTNTQGDGQLYIECQPTDESDDTVNVQVKSKQPVDFDIGEYFTFQYMKYIYFALCVIVFLYLISYLLNMVKQ